MFRNMLILLSMSLISLGCFSSDLHVKIHFDQINGLKAGERVLFEQNDIGRVTDVFYGKDGIYLVDVAINSDFKNAATGNSRFFIVNDPTDPGSKAIEMITVKGEGRPLEDGALVEGATRLSALLEKMEDDVSSTMGDLKKRFKKFSEELKEVPENEDMKRLQKDLDQLLDEMKRSGAALRDKVQKELAPRLQEEIDKLKERLKEFGREKEVEPLQTRMDEIREI
jgi:ABC-type transporter Mla subunit MlaD